MPRFSTQRKISQILWYIHGFSLLMVIVLFFLKWTIGIIALVVFLVLFFVTQTVEKAFVHELRRYTITLTQRVKKAAKEAARDLPIGMLLYNDEGIIEWHNPFIGRMLDKESVV